MNKKIKVIDLIDKIYHKNNIPKRIKYKYKIWLYDNVEERYCLEDSSFVSLAFETDRLTDEVEILEDNTEEIEELDKFDIQGLEVSGYSMTQAEYLLEDGIEENRQKINELVKAINEIRKDKSND